MNTSFNLTYLEMGVARGEAGVAPANPTPHLQNSRGWRLRTCEWGNGALRQRTSGRRNAIGVPTRGRG